MGHRERIPCCSRSGLPRLRRVRCLLCFIYPPALSIVCRLSKPARNSRSLCRRRGQNIVFICLSSFAVIAVVVAADCGYCMYGTVPSRGLDTLYVLYVFIYRPAPTISCRPSGAAIQNRSFSRPYIFIYPCFFILQRTVPYSMHSLLSNSCILLEFFEESDAGCTNSHPRHRTSQNSCIIQGINLSDSLITVCHFQSLLLRLPDRRRNRRLQLRKHVHGQGVLLRPVAVLRSSFLADESLPMPAGS